MERLPLVVIDYTSLGITFYFDYVNVFVVNLRDFYRAEPPADPLICPIIPGKDTQIEINTDNRILGLFFIGGKDTATPVSKLFSDFPLSLFLKQRNNISNIMIRPFPRKVSS